MDTNALPSTSDSKLSSSSETGKHLVNLKLKSESDDVSNSKNDFTETPSCVVCGDEASGRHYRAMTCEGCKTFFRRNAARRDLLKCDMDEAGDCVINRFLRRHCAYCRMQKCLKAGMQVERVWDKERVKTRKRIDKKSKQAASSIPNAPSPAEDQHEDIIITPEMQELLDSIQRAFDHASHQILHLTPRPSPHKDCVIHAPRTESQPTQEMQGNDNGNHGNQNKDISTATCVDCKLDKDLTDGNANSKRTTAADDLSNIKCTFPQHGESDSHNSGEENGDKDKSCKCCDVTGLEDGDGVPLIPESMESMSVDRGSSKSCQDCQGTSELPSSSSPSSYSVLRQDTQESSSLSLSMPTPESKVHSDTQLVNVDKTITSYIMEMSLLSLRHMIAFAKLLPIFTTLSWESQAALIKGAFVEYIVIGAMSQFDLENQRVNSFFNPGKAVYERKTLEKAGLGNAFNQVFGMAEKFCGLHLDKKEEAMMFALSILSPDRPGLDDAAKTTVGNIQEELADVLRVSLQRKNEVKFCFPKAMMLLTDLRNATETYRSDVMQVELHANVITPLLAELFDM